MAGCLTLVRHSRAVLQQVQTEDDSWDMNLSLYDYRLIYVILWCVDRSQLLPPKENNDMEHFSEARETRSSP